MIKREDFDSYEQPAVYACPPTIQQSVAILLEVMVCAYYFCTGRMYIGHTHKVAL